jgi:chromodomain-helicase-DNA-binding protein 1
MVEETLAPRAARNKKSYVEDHQLDKNSNRKRRGIDAQEKPRRRSSRTMDTAVSLPLIDGSAHQVREWSFGNLSKKDATRFVRAVNLHPFSIFFSFMWRFYIYNIQSHAIMFVFSSP